MSQRDPTQDAKSIARRLEVALVEAGGGKLVSERKTEIVFSTLDRLIPQLGLYAQATQVIRDNLHAAIYSDDYTVRPDLAGGPVQPVPYFTLVRRVFRERDTKYDELERQLDIVKERLFEKQRELEETRNKVTSFEMEAEEMAARIEELDKTLMERDGTINKLESDLNKEQEDHKETKFVLEGDIKDLQEEGRDKDQDISHLTRFKDGYDKLHDAFVVKGEAEQPPPPQSPSKRKRVAMDATKRAHLVSGIEDARKIETQLLFVMNSLLEDYDRFLEAHKEELAAKTPPEEEDFDAIQMQDMEIDAADQQLLQMQERFTTGVSDLNEELELLRTHVTMLQEQLQDEMKQQQAKKAQRRAPISDSGRPITRDSASFTAGLEEETDTAETREPDPFIPQERVFSKYAAMLYSSSNGGKTWYEFKDAKYCASCGEKTVICPHRVGMSEHVTMVPIDTTHIRIVRPVVRINAQMVDEAMRQAYIEASQGGLQPPSSADSRWRIDSSSMAALKSRGDYSLMTPSTPATGKDTPSLAVAGDAHMKQRRDSDSDAESEEMVNSIHRLWDDFKERSGLDRAIPRPLAVDRTLSMYQQFLAYLVWDDEMAEYQDSRKLSILDKLYAMMGQRYLVGNVSYLATHDLITSVVEHSSVCKLFQIWMHVLAGNLAGATLRYVSVLADFILGVEWQEVFDFKEFAAVVYPFLGEDDLDNLLMGYTSFSSNKMSGQLVWDYLMSVILKQREPRFQELETKLVPASATYEGQLTEQEYTEVLENIVPAYSEHLRKVLYVEVAAALAQTRGATDAQTDSVPISRLSQVTAYLQLLQLQDHVRNVLPDRIAKARAAFLSEQGITTKLKFESQVVPNQVPLMTMHDAKLLAINISSRVVGGSVFLPSEVHLQTDHTREQSREKRKEEEEFYD